MRKRTSKRVKTKTEMTQVEYARHRGVSRYAVTKWKQQGKLVPAPSGRIDVRKTDALLDPQPSRKSPPKKSPAKKSRKRSRDPEMNDILQGVKALLEKTGLLSKYEAEQVKENYLALLRKIEFEIKAGKLVEVDPLKRSLFELWRRERDALLNLPSRVGAVIAAELGVDQNRLTILLEKHIHEFLHERADQPRLRFA